MTSRGRPEKFGRQVLNHSLALVFGVQSDPCHTETCGGPDCEITNANVVAAVDPSIRIGPDFSRVRLAGVIGVVRAEHRDSGVALRDYGRVRQDDLIAVRFRIP